MWENVWEENSYPLIYIDIATFIKISLSSHWLHEQGFQSNLKTLFHAKNGVIATVSSHSRISSTLTQ